MPHHDRSIIMHGYGQFDALYLGLKAERRVRTSRMRHMTLRNAQ